MKKTLYILLSLAIVACSKGKSKNMETIAVEAAEIEYEIADDKTYFNSNTETTDHQYVNMAAQKLQDLYDLVLLQKKHPEFEDDIKTQLKELTIDSFTLNNDFDEISIENIRQNGSLAQISDSIQEMKLDFDVVLNDTIMANSIFVKIISNTIVLDNKNVKTNKIRFSKSKFKE